MKSAEESRLDGAEFCHKKKRMFAIGIALAVLSSQTACVVVDAFQSEDYEETSVGIVELLVPDDLTEVEAPESSIWEVIYQDGDTEAGGEGVTTQLLIAPEMEGATTAMDGPSRFLTLAYSGAYEGFRALELDERPSWEQEANEERGDDERDFVRHRYVWLGPDGTEYEAVTWGIYDGAASAAMVQYVSADLDEEIARTIDESLTVD